MSQRISQRGAVALAQVLLVGGVILGGAGVGVGVEQLAGGGGETVEVNLDAVPTFDCPGGSRTGELHRGDRVLATGRDEDGDFVEVRDPLNLGARVWVAARYLVPDADLSGLDVRECTPDEDDGQEAAPTLPGETLPPELVTTTTRAGGPAPPPPPADTTGPSIGGPASNRNPIWEANIGNTCNSNPALFTTATVSASVSDPSGVSSVTMSWQVGGTSGSKPMGGSGNYSATLGPFPETTVNGNAGISITITAVDGLGNQRTAGGGVTLNDCVFG